MSKNKSNDSKGNTSDSNSDITRRDFIGGTLIGAGAALLSAKAPGALAASGPKADEFKLGRTMPLGLNKLDKSWTGPGGIGDYATSNGNTHVEVNAAHTFRNGDFEEQVASAKATGEEYDLVVVGAGFAGCSAAYYYQKDHPDAKILILDNHDMFGGEARQNEFEVDGYKLWAPQGSTGVVWPLEWAKKVEMYAPIWDELGMPQNFEWQEAKGSDLKIPYDNYSPMHISWEQTDLGWFHDGHKMAVNPWSNRFKDVPISQKTKNDLIWMEVYRQPPRRDDWDQWLDSMTYKDFLVNEMGIDNQEVDDYLNPFMAAMGCGLGTDAVSALQAFNFISPGVQQYMRYMDLGDPTDNLYLAQFPGGNTGTLRRIVQKVIPDIFGKTTTLSEVLSNPVDWKVIDKAGSPARMRLSSLVVNVVHEGPVNKAKTVKVTYLKDDKMRYVRAKHVVMGGQQHLNKRVVTDLPKAHKEAMDEFMHAPMMVVNVALRNWKFMDKMGVSAVRWFGDDMGWFFTLRRQMILDGKEPMPLDPEKPIAITMYNSFCKPGMPVDKQTVAARMRMFSLSYADIEKNVREQFTKMFAAGGFDADRDIAGITVNRQGHAYVVTPPGFFFGKNGKPAPSDVIRQPHGRISFAHAELRGMQMWEGATHEGERAAHQAAGKKH
ncbi:MAG: FAD-dependent oxidoreductase [Gammaproteobacteria bacterium]|nr:FAD-dependent oxidoreductase [Gammaproteobacteria bacterium]